MLKTGLLCALVAPLLFKPRAVIADNDDGCVPPFPPMPELPGLDPTPIAIVATDGATDDIPWPDLPAIKTAEEAVAEFLALLVDEAGAGARIPFTRVAASYDRLRRGGVRKFDETGGCRGYAPRAWPEISGKALSTLLCAQGCERDKAQTRDANGRRLTTIVIVPALAFDEDEIEPMRLAA